MFRIEVNCDCKTQVLVNWIELSEEYADYDNYRDWIDECFHIMSMFEEAYPKLVENLQEIDKYRYSIDCDDEEQAEDVEDWFSMLFDQLEWQIEVEIGELVDTDDEEW